MIDVSTIEYNPVQERIVNVINQKTQNYDRKYFRTLIVYQLCRLASMMRTNIEMHDGQIIPVNAYTLNLAPSGFSKGRSMNIVEDDILNQFNDVFLSQTMVSVAEQKIYEIAQKRAAINNSDFDEELEKAQTEFKECGHYMTSFAEGTSAALKQMRHKLIMMEIGSLNQEVDEIGYNLQKNADLLKDYLELYDVGKIKDKLIKNTKDNKRATPMKGRTPANVILFGVPEALFDGGQVESLFWSFQESGYARRSFFGYGEASTDSDLDVDTAYHIMTSKNISDDVATLSNLFGSLASRDYYNITLKMSVAVAKKHLEYKLSCEKTASTYAAHEKSKQAEMQHRHFKAIKLAGAYAWVDKSPTIEMKHLLQAIKQTEESGESFQKILVRARNYEKLAKYLGECNKEVTHVDLTEDLPFYPSQKAQREAMLEMAIAYGHKDNIVIKRRYIDGIEFISGESLKETDLNKLMLSYTTGERRNPDGSTYVIEHPVDGYKFTEAPFNQLHNLTQQDNMHWVNHALSEGYRNDENVIKGFNCVVIDVDGTLPLEIAKLALEKYTYHIYTTKRHTETVHRYRILLPISHILKLNKKEFTEFMTNVLDWFPADTDDGAKSYSKKWMTHKGQYWYNEGELLDARQFIPNTKKCEDHQKVVADMQSIPRLERYFCLKASEGNRNQTVIKYALMLVDTGLSLSQVEEKVNDMNSKLSNPLSDEELQNTIFKTVARKISETE